MEKIDRLGWVAGLAFVTCGARIGIRVNEPAILERLPEFLPPEWRPAASPVVDELYSLVVGSSGPQTSIRRYHLLYAGSARLARTMDLAEVFQSLAADLHLSVAVSARTRLFVDGGVVDWHGRGLVILGSRGSGTSTLVAALVRAGASCFSDGYAVFDARGRVHPYPKPLCLCDVGAGPGRPWRVQVPSCRAGTKPVPVALVALTEYQPGARWRPRALSPGQALLALLEKTAQAHLRPEFALATLQRVVNGALALKSKRGEAEEIVTALFNHLETEPAPTWNHAESRRNGSAGSRGSLRRQAGRKEEPQ